MKHLLVASAFVMLTSLSMQVGADCAWIVMEGTHTPDQMTNSPFQSVRPTTEVAETLAQCETKSARLNKEKQLTEQKNKRGEYVAFLPTTVCQLACCHGRKEDRP